MYVCIMYAYFSLHFCTTCLFIAISVPRTPIIQYMTRTNLFLLCGEKIGKSCQESKFVNHANSPACSNKIASLWQYLCSGQHGLDRYHQQ